MAVGRLTTLLWIFMVHLAGIYLFTRGFLLTRLSLPDVVSCGPECSLPPTHIRAVVLLIDALRFDFVSPDPPSPLSPNHHNVLTLPQRLTATHPEHSFLFDSHADPPTTTLQRIKGITTGSLPTFIDVGNNMGASSITEDSIMFQLKQAGKRVAFMGDDTWMSVFPEAFQPNMTYPHDSFNVEDLHTVDEAVITHLFPLLEDESKPFDFLIGHFLGVDHVGHRVGPDHPLMKAKLQQMNDVLERVVQKLDDETLLVLLGDHGMDRSGDHGGDGVLETSAAMWIYSKGAPLTQTKSPIPSGLLQYRNFPGASIPHRTIQQIDLLPTLSLLLGLPIPFNNLGNVIPELFWRDSQGHILERALDLNAQQIQQFLTTYRTSPSGGELDDAWNDLQQAWISANSLSATDAKSIAMVDFARKALMACRVMWAQFNPVLMGMGLVLFVLSICSSWALYVGLSDAKEGWQEWIQDITPQYLMAGAGGGFAGGFASLALQLFPSVLEGVALSDYIVFGATLASCVAIIVLSPPIKNKYSLTLSPSLLILHAAAFLSNSFVVWEDHIIPLFAVTAIVPYAIKGFSAPTSRLRYRIVGFSFLFALAIRLMSISTVCREEQQLYCDVTFYTSFSVTAPPTFSVILALPVAIGLPWIITRFLQISLSDKGIAKTYYPAILAPALIGGTLYWTIEWVDSTDVVGESWTTVLRVLRTWVARFAFSWVILLGGALWYIVPLCLQVVVSPVAGGKKQVQVIGFANAYGSPYLIFWTIFLSIIWTTSQAPAQVVLGLATVALLAFLEVVDSVRDVRQVERAFAANKPSALLQSNSNPMGGPIGGFELVTFLDVIPIALLGLHTFYTTGHQSTISSIQWKSSFLVTPTVVYPWSAITVVVNSIGPLFLFAVAIPLLALWNQSPTQSVGAPTGPTEAASKSTTSPQKDGSASTPQADPSSNLKLNLTLASIGAMTYTTALLLGASISAAVLRRHLMVWKIFAPRFMVGVLMVLAVDIGILVGVLLGVTRVEGYVRKVVGGFGGGKVEREDKNGN